MFTDVTPNFEIVNKDQNCKEAREKSLKTFANNWYCIQRIENTLELRFMNWVKPNNIG